VIPPFTLRMRAAGIIFKLRSEPPMITNRELQERLKLTDDERLLVMLYYAEELSIAECAAVLGVSNFVASAMHRDIQRRTLAAIQDEERAA
jgi:DNA-directed RNA polymerase specialized sigma subunit